MRGFDKCCFSRYFVEVGGKMELQVPLEKKWTNQIVLCFTVVIL